MDDKLWVGKFFTPTIGRRYMVPHDAANYADLRGKEGECIAGVQSAHGHSWALVKFDNIGNRSIRTTYLLPVDSIPEEPLVEDFTGSMSPAEKQDYALNKAVSDGPVVLKSSGPPVG